MVICSPCCLPARTLEGSTGSMSAKQVRDECLTLLLAGHETTANGLSFIFFLMAQHPERAGKSICRSIVRIRNRLFQSASDRRRCLRATAVQPASCVRSAANVPACVGHGAQLRQCPTPIVAWRFLPVPCCWFRKSQFTAMRAGTPSPCISIPTAFLPEAIAARPRHAYFPFGAGSRICIGENFAWMEAVLVLASVIRNWRLGFEGPIPTELPLSAQISLRPRDPVAISATKR